jgi:putative colanic acid biosysnthesis UDP-glucose lipid carrier transferase
MPQSISSLVAALIEPCVHVLVYAVLALLAGRPMATADLTLCLLTFLLGFPGANRYMSRPLDAATDILAAWAALLSVLAVCGYVTRSLDLFDAQVLFAWALLSPLAQWVLYALGRQAVFSLAARPGQRRSAVVIGAGPLGATVARALGRRGPVGHSFLGYFDDRDEAQLAPEARRERLGGLADVAEFVRANAVHEVYLTLPLGAQPPLAGLIEQLQGTTASLYLVPDVFGISIVQGRLEEMNGVPVVGLCETPFTGVNRALKRACDLVLASIILTLLAPVLLGIALAVRLTSPGPAIFRQRRNGLDGREIVVYKFRSMRTQDDGAVVRQATRGDARITPLGAFLRRTSLDELPQFINVLQGRMSIVGPRPHAVAHNEQYRDLITAYMVRHKVKPGITGWAQVNGCRGETETVDKMRARIAYDLEYLRNWSLALDLRIVARTVRLVFADSHAY